MPNSNESIKEPDVVHDPSKVEIDDGHPAEDPKGPEEEENRSPEEEEELVNKKYGGLIKKKPPLITKDHERAFFDSADWALGKQGGQKSKGPAESLRPKLEPTPHQQLRTRLSAASLTDDGEENSSPDQSRAPEADGESNSQHQEHQG